MRIKIFLYSFLLLSYCQGLFSLEEIGQLKFDSQLVISTKRIQLDAYPEAFNPSLIKTERGFLLTFRVLPDPLRLWINYIGIVLLDKSFNPISEPQLLDTRKGNKLFPSQSEDARIFSYQGNLYVLYNDNNSFINPSFAQRRDMFIAQLTYDNHQFVVSEPKKLYHQQKYSNQKWQKNWVPFEWHGALLMSYSLIPHEVLYVDLDTGECAPLMVTPLSSHAWEWHWGHLRGGTPALLMDREYLAFFHSYIELNSVASNGIRMPHYFMGAYTFSSEPPFKITKISASPIIGKEFYTPSSLPKRVIFPGGYVVTDRHIYLAYGKDDQEIWIATINKERLKEILMPIEP
jgi:predicted GH43/DUF377 family glycosyl hydrolase